MRTLHLTTVDLTAFCFLRSWFRHLRAHGHEVALACDFQRFQEPLAQDCDQLFQVAIPRRIRPWQDLRAFLRLLGLMRRYRPEVVHTHTSKAGFLGRLAARLCGVPLVLHTIHELPQNAARNPWIQGLYRGLEQLAAHWCHHLITVSEVNRKQILAERICDPEKLSFIREGLELERYRPAIPGVEMRRSWGLPDRARVLGMAARLEPAKGHHDLLMAFQTLAAGHPDLHLVLMGTGLLEAELRARVNESGLTSRVHFLGWVEDLVSAIAALDMFVLSSHYEGLGIVLLEALALGVPTVSTRVGGTQDILVHEVYGLFAEPHHPSDLARQIERFLENPAWARELARAGQHYVHREFRAEVADARMLELYLKLQGRAR